MTQELSWNELRERQINADIERMAHDNVARRLEKIDAGEFESAQRELQKMRKRAAKRYCGRVLPD